jgi:DNA-binding PadR family transcriptional regulator
VSTSRLLILGVLMQKQPIHGYDVRRELEEWGAEGWSNLAYGSIYFALNKMTEEGLVIPSGGEQTGKRPARTQYTLTEKGKQEFYRLMREYWWKYEMPIDSFQVAMTFMDKLSHDELLEALRYRFDLLRAWMRTYEVGLPKNMYEPNIPKHVIENLRLSYVRVRAEIEWLQEVIAKVERGELP